MWERGLKLTEWNPVFREKRVAPRVGAWIETALNLEKTDAELSLPVWERGLKHTEGPCAWL